MKTREGTPAPDEVVHQTIHGYGHGHQLLASSLVLDDETANSIVHHSDSAPGSQLRDGPYLSGYPVASDQYVLAKTWPDTSAERPNTVVTRSLLLSRTALRSVGSDALLLQLARPNLEDLPRQLTPIDLERVKGGPSLLSAKEAAVAANFFVSDDPLPATAESSRERVALAIWQQLWIPARGYQYLCTSPGTTRFSKHHRTLRFAGSEKLAPEQGSSAAIDTIVADLAKPGRFREFVHFVGSGEKSTTLMVAFAVAFSLLEDVESEVDDLERLLDAAGGTPPSRLRRLKRRVLSTDPRDQQWNVEPLSLLRGLGEGDLGRSVYASDASLGGWLLRAWSLDAAATLHILDSLPHLEAGQQTEPVTAGEGLASAFELEIPNLLTSASLEAALGINERATIAAIWRRNEQGLWRQWATVGSSFGALRPVEETRQYDWSIPVSAVRDDPQALSQLLRLHAEALDTLVMLAETAPSESDLAVPISRDLKRQIAKRVEHSEQDLTGLSRLSRPKSIPRTLRPQPWIDLLSSRDDEIVAVTAYLTVRRHPCDFAELLALSFAILFDALAERPAEEAWERLAKALKVDRSEWDRCALLTSDCAKVLLPCGSDDRELVRQRVRRHSKPAAHGLQQRLDHPPRKPKRFNVFDPTSW